MVVQRRGALSFSSTLRLWSRTGVPQAGSPSLGTRSVVSARHRGQRRGACPFSTYAGHPSRHPEAIQAVIPAKGDLCTTVIPAKAGIQMGGGPAWIASLPTPGLPRSESYARPPEAGIHLPYPDTQIWPEASLGR